MLPKKRQHSQQNKQKACPPVKRTMVKSRSIRKEFKMRRG